MRCCIGLAKGILTSSLVAGLLAGCGGSGNPLPVVQFTSPTQASTITFGQTVKLAWNSLFATSCSAAASSLGGAFTGTQQVNGEASVAPTGPGAVNYTLTCTGAGGMTVASSPTITVNPSILKVLSGVKPVTIGSTLDPIEKGGNAYGLAIAPVTSGLITAGDLVVCNFNDGATNTNGLGTTIVGLHPTPGASPYRIAQDQKLQGCNALAILPDDSISAAAFSANQNPLVSAAGVVNTPFASDSFNGPWGEAFVAATADHPAALYVADIGGAIDRIELEGDTQSAFVQIATGFCGSGVPGSIFAPAGLTYDASIDTLYVVDTSSNSVVALAKVSSIGAGGLIVNGQCRSVAAPPTPAPSFSGTSASSARVIAHGGALIAPVSSALLADGDLIIINDDANITAGQQGNLAVEVSPVLPGGFVGAPVQLDSGPASGLFGVVATVDSHGKQLVYFNDDNINSVVMLSAP